MDKKKLITLLSGTDNDPITGRGCVGSGNDRGARAGDAHRGQYGFSDFVYGSGLPAGVAGRWLCRLCK